MNKKSYVPPFILIAIASAAWTALAMLMCLLISTNINASEFKTSNIPYDEISSGSLYFKSSDKNNESYYPAITQNSDYQVNVNGLLSSVNFTQTFKNSSDDFLEAIYVFPLIDDASVSSMIMEIGERRIVGKIKEKQQAKKLYEKAKIQGKKVSLVSQQRPNLFTTKVANIAPGETIKISLSYLQSISLNDEIFSLRIPLTLTPRFIPLLHNNVNDDTVNSTKTINKTKINSYGWAINNDRVKDANEITPFQMNEKSLKNNENKQQTVTLALNINGGLPLININSLYHKIIHTQINDQNSITLANAKALLNQDFVLQWQLAQGNIPKAAFFQQSDADNIQKSYQYGLLMVMPPKQDDAQPFNKDVVYIIDTSGSMGGVAIRQAKKALVTALDLLNPEDTFNIIAFDNNTQHLFRLSKSVTTQNIKQAKHWISNLEAGGGTNMYPAIEQALKASQSENSYRQVIFITDGSIGNEVELFNLIDKQLTNARLHTVGIGSAPNSYFMSEAAKAGRGTYRYIGSINEVNEQMTQLFTQISKPLMQGIELTWPTKKVELFPKKIPDLYAGQPLLISARWLKSEVENVNGIITISGTLTSTPWQEQIEISTDTDLTVDNGVAQWWAKEKINHLTLLHRRGSKQSKVELKDQITQLALKHHLLSPYTSFIAVEEQLSRTNNMSMKTKAVKNLMPKGSTQAIPMANTALGIAGYFYFSLLFIIAAIMIQVKRSFLFQYSGLNKLC